MPRLQLDASTRVVSQRSISRSDGAEMRAEDIEGRTFFIEFRGYDRAEVDQFLREVADEFRALSHPLANDDFDALGREVAGVLRAAHEAAELMKSEAFAEAARIRQDAELHRLEVASVDRVRSDEELLVLEETRRFLLADIERLRSEVSAQQARFGRLTTHVRAALEDIRSQVRVARSATDDASLGQVPLPPSVQERLGVVEDEVELAIMAVDEGIPEVPSTPEQQAADRH